LIWNTSVKPANTIGNTKPAPNQGKSLMLGTATPPEILPTRNPTTPASDGRLSGNWQKVHKILLKLLTLFCKLKKYA